MAAIQVPEQSAEPLEFENLPDAMRYPLPTGTVWKVMAKNPVYKMTKDWKGTEKEKPKFTESEMIQFKESYELV